MPPSPVSERGAVRHLRALFTAGLSGLLALGAAPALGAPPETKAPFRVRPESEIPAGPEGERIRRGLQLAGNTERLLPAHVGNGLRCTSCHLQSGRVANAGPWVGLSAVFPEYRTRNAKMNSLAERVNDCFERSLNGLPLPEDGEEMKAFLAYIDWLSEGVPRGVSVQGRGFQRISPAPVPDRARGKRLFEAKCSWCHSMEGRGLKNPDGSYLIPALGGAQTFNIGAGMARLDTAAAFIRHNMPLGQGGSLTDQEAYDIADYFIHLPRPDFARKSEDWPKGGKPRDARY
jgi:thiosulfate dehydrogenase